MPQTIAIIGASTDRTKFGNVAVRAYRDRGWTVYPVHPALELVEGLRVYSTIKDVPGPLLRISLYVPPRSLLRLLADVAAAGADQVWFNPGTDSPAALEEARRLGINVVQGCSIVDVGTNPAIYLA